jgi:hypothetical protein
MKEETKLFRIQVKLDNLVRLCDDDYQFNRYSNENINERSSRDDPRLDSSHSEFWTASLAEDDDVVRRQLCIDMITIISPAHLMPPLEKTIMVDYSHHPHAC